MTLSQREAVREVSAPVIAWMLLALAILRALAAFVSPGLAWGIGAARDVHPAIATLVLGLAAAAALAAIARTLPPAVADNDFARFRAWPWALGAVLTVLLVACPDRVRFVGDFVLRAGILESERGFEKIFPQALPLDALLNHALPVRLGAWLHVDPLLVLRAMGVLEAWLLVATAARFARVAATREAVAATVATALCCGGLAVLLTGYSKPTPQVALAALAVATLGVEQVLRGSGRVPFALATAFGIAIHRGGLPLLFPWAVVSALVLRRHGLGAGRARLVHVAALLLPLAVLALEAPKLVSVIASFDAPVNFLPDQVRAQGGVLAAAFAPVRLLDDLNAVLLHAPLAPLLLLGGPAAWRAWRRAPGATIVLASCVLAFLPVLLFVYLPLGPFRDFDSLGAMGAVLGVATAWMLAAALEPAAPRALAVAVVAGAAAPFLILLLSFTDLPRGFAHAEAIVAGPPARNPTQRASALDWLGLRALNEDDYDRARDAYHRLCVETPVPHALKLWGAAALIAERPAEAEQAFDRLLAGSPDDPVGWYGLWMSATVAGDTLAARRAAGRAQAWATGSREMRDVVEFFDHYPRLYAILRRTLPR